MKSFLCDFVCFRTNKKFLTAFNTQTFSMSKRKNKMINDHSYSALSQGDDNNYDDNYNEKDAAMEIMDANGSKLGFLFKMHLICTFSLH